MSSAVYSLVSLPKGEERHGYYDEDVFDPSKLSSHQYTSGYNPPELPSNHYTGNQRPVRDPAYHPLSTVILALWIVYMGITFWVLETAVANAPRSVDQPWHLRALPSILLTVFVQGHTGVTSIHLARLGVSALQSRKLAPRTWIELFWLADGNYQGPTGLATVGIGMLRLRTFVSKTFLLFALTSVVALITPLVVSRAYPIATIDVRQTVQFWPDALSSPLLNVIDPLAPQAIGTGGWTSGMSISELYNTSVYTPVGVTRSDSPMDFFFASDTDGLDVTLPGVRILGQCSALSDTIVNNSQALADMCNHLPGLESDITVNFTFSISVREVTIQGSWCARSPTGSNGLTSSGFVFFNTTNLTASTQGVVECNSQIRFGNASLRGLEGAFDAFKDNTADFINASVSDPFFSAMNLLTITPDWKTVGARNLTDEFVEQAGSGILAMLGFGRSGEAVSVFLPTLDELASRLWKGASHMGAGVNLAIRRNDQEFPAVQRIPVSGRTRDDTFRAVALILISLWALLLMYCTMRMFRPTFGDTLASYVPARLALNQPDIVGAQPSGQLLDNVHLKKQFGYVDRASARVIQRSGR
jgi:hypothetical protein